MLARSEQTFFNDDISYSKAALKRHSYIFYTIIVKLYQHFVLNHEIKQPYFNTVAFMSLFCKSLWSLLYHYHFNDSLKKEKKLFIRLQLSLVSNFEITRTLFSLEFSILCISICICMQIYSFNHLNRISAWFFSIFSAFVFQFLTNTMDPFWYHNNVRNQAFS